MVIQNPKQLVDEFKKSGEFDRLRRQLLTHFANSDEVRPLMSRVEEIARDKLSSDERLEHKSREAVHSEVMQDMERYPIVERAVADLAVLNDEALVSSIEQYVRNIVRGESNEETRLWNARTSHRKKGKGEDEVNDESSEYSEDEDPDDDELLIITDANRTNTSSSPQHVGGTSAGHSLLNGHPSRSPNHQYETMPFLAHPSSPRTSPPVKPEELGPQTPLWQTDPEGIKTSVSSVASPSFYFHGGNDSRSTLGVPSSDSMAGELLVNGVPVGGLVLDDDKEGTEREACHETEPDHNSNDARAQQTSQGEGESRITDETLGISTTSSEQKLDIEKDGPESSSARSTEDQLPPTVT